MGRPVGYRFAKTAPAETPTPHDIIWAAGFFEGDGHPSRTDTTEQARIIQKDRWVLDKLRSLFGGTVGVHYSVPARTTYYWLVAGARARGFLMSTYELLSPRRQVQVRRVMGWPQH